MNKERLRGINLGGWFSQIDAIEEKDPKHFPGIDQHMETFLGAADFGRIAQWGFNHVRLPIDFHLFFNADEQPLVHRLKLLDGAIQDAADHSLSLILDLHKCPGHDFHDGGTNEQKLFGDPQYVKKTQRIWAHLAERYGQQSHVLFEILNEPVAPNGTTWNGIRDALVRDLRRHAPQTTIIAGSNMWNWPSTFAEMTPADDDNMIYCFHFYEPLLFTHQTAPWLWEEEFKTRWPYPADYGKGVTRMYGMVFSKGQWDKDRMRQEIEPVIAFGQTHKVPIICNEFGTYVRASREHQLVWLEDFLSVLEENQIGFSYWNYKNLDFGIISQGESLHQDLLQYHNPDHLDAGLLNILKNH